MIQPVSSAPASLPNAPTSVAKPWAFGDASSFEQLFSPMTQPGTAATPAPAPAAASAPAAAASAPISPFTFEQDATMTGYGTSAPLNPEELATAETADRLAKMLGGTVKEEPAFGGEWVASAPTRDIYFKDSNVTMNAGVAAYLFNAYGDKPGSQAWQQINRALGREVMSTI